MSVRNWFKFIFLALIWGTSFFWIKIAVQEISPFMLVMLRVSFAMLGMLALMIWRKRRIPFGWYWLGFFAFIGFFNVALPFVLISWSEQYIASGLTSVLNSTTPLFTFIMALFLLPDEHLGKIRMFGLALGFCGVVVLMADKFGAGINNSLLGILGVLFSAFCYGTSTVFARRFGGRLDGQVMAMGQIGLSFIFMLPITLIVDSPLVLPVLPITWFALAWLGLFGSALATVLFFSLLNTIGPTRTSFVSYLVPVTGMILGILFLGESASWYTLIGAVMVLGGVVLVNSQVQSSSIDHL